MAILATLEIPDVTVNAVQGDNRHRRFEGLYSNSKNLCAFYSTATSAEGRYVRPWQGTFKGLGSWCSALPVFKFRHVECPTPDPSNAG